MNCAEFEGNIQSFIRGELPDEIYDGFIEHYCNCSECNEELEILYLVHYVINSDELDTASFNLKAKLSSHMKAIEDQVYRRYKSRFLKNSAIITAEISAVISAIVFVASFVV